MLDRRRERGLHPAGSGGAPGVTVTAGAVTRKSPGLVVHKGQCPARVWEARGLEGWATPLASVPPSTLLSTNSEERTVPERER